MKIIQTSGKRKGAIARATVKEGKGTVTINNRPYAQIEPKLSRLKISEPLLLAKDQAAKVDIAVRVHGGGTSSQADASRLAIAKGLVAFSKSDKLKTAFLKYDRNMLVADVRRKEPSKPNRHGQARAKVAKSYR